MMSRRAVHQPSMLGARSCTAPYGGIFVHGRSLDLIDAEVACIIAALEHLHDRYP